MWKMVGQVLAVVMLAGVFTLSVGAQELDPNPGLESGEKGLESLVMPEVQAQAMTSGHNVSYVDKLSFGVGNQRTIAVDGSAGVVFAGLRSTLVIVDIAVVDNLYRRGWIDLDDNIMALDVDTGNQRAYAVSASGTLYVIDVSDYAAPAVLGTMTFGNNVTTVQINGSYLYVTDNTGALFTVNVLDPSSPQLQGTDSMAYSGKDLEVFGSYLFALSSSDLEVYDISDPSNPAYDSTYNTGGNTITTSGSHAYVTRSGSGIDVIDASIPNSLSFVTNYATASSAQDAVAVSSKLYVACSSHLEIVSISSPASPSQLGVTSTSSGGRGLAAGWISAFVLNNAGMESVDATNSASPSVVDTFKTLGGTEHVTRFVDWAIVSLGNSGLVAWDVSNPTNPQEVWEEDPPGYFHSTHQINGSAMAAARGSEGVTYYSFDGSSFTAEDTYNTGGNARRVASGGPLLFVADQAGDIVVIDSFDVMFTGLQPVATLTLDGNSNDVVVSSNYLFVATTVGLQVIKDPSTSWSIPFTHNYSGTERGVFLVGDTLYLASTTGGMHILDVSNHESPAWLATWAPPGVDAQDVTVNGNLAYVANGANGVWVVDISDPSNPTEVAFHQTPDAANHAVSDGSYVWAADDSEGAYVIQFGYTGMCGDDHEPNDTMAAADAITAGSFYTAKICHNDDKDWFSIALAAAGDLQVDMHPPVGLDYDLFLYDDSGALVAYSILSGDSTESLIYTSGGAGTYFIYIQGHGGNQSSDSVSYTLIPTFTASGGGSCSLTPDELLYIPNVTLDGNGKPVLHIQDPNQAGAVTGYNIYRSDSGSGPWSLIASDVTDMDEGTANVQYVDLTGDVGGPWFYQAAAYNNVCGAEGPY